jgi:hypothetical protein
MKKGMCKGCDHLTKKAQVHFYDKTGMFKLDKPKKIVKPFCLSWSLHITDTGGYGYIDRILEDPFSSDPNQRDKLVCPRYCSGGIS